MPPSPEQDLRFFRRSHAGVLIRVLQRSLQLDHVNLRKSFRKQTLSWALTPNTSSYNQLKDLKTWVWKSSVPIVGGVFSLILPAMGERSTVRESDAISSNQSVEMNQSLMGAETDSQT